MIAATHRPVLLRETIAALAPAAGAVLFDGTLGLGGHSLAWLEATAAAGAPGRVVATDRDPEALAVARDRLESAFPGRAHVVRGTFETVRAALADAGVAQADAALLDLGVSSLQLDAASRGFSFQAPGPLDMRMDPDHRGDSAADVVNRRPEAELARILAEYGEEPAAARIAKAIVAERARAPFRDTLRLAETIARAAGGRRSRLHPATRAFQALRIEVNDELGCLRRGLPAVAACLRAGGRLAVLGFHRLEDREVKQFLAAEALRGTLRTLGDASPTVRETRENPRSRSARLRWAEWTARPLGGER